MLGILEIAGRGSGFLRRREVGYLPANGDVHVGERLIRQHDLRAGDEIMPVVLGLVKADFLPGLVHLHGAGIQVQVHRGLEHARVRHAAA